MENVTSVLKSADGPTSIFVAGKTPEIMGALIATVVVGVIIALFGLKIVRVLSALVGLAIWRHRANIVRLMNGTENKFGTKKGDK